ncbi:MAG TPA: DNA mismatch repair endonuclease MutH [Polyangiaceae bacterium]|jgi:DNA mismatch repair protein MutH
MKERADAPKTVEELLARARALAGRSVGELARERGLSAPPDLRRAKGFVGELLERALGATAASRAQPDFETLGVELKTLPVDPSGKPLESTFVCTIPLTEIGEVEWARSRVRRKLERVLWVPVEGMRDKPVPERRLGEPLLWSLDTASEAALRFDWEELAGLIGRGDVEAITGHIGRYLQIRPKARNGQARRRGIDVDGAPFAALPRGFYLRPSFTREILRAHYALGG